MAGRRDTYAVIGGEGFLGHALILALHEKYPQAVLLSLDVVQRHYPQKGEWEFRSCDLTDEASLSSALGQGVSGVFHTASPHIGGTKELCEKVNVEGTRNIVEVCRKLGITKLVYTSSAGIPFDCTDLINVDERCTPAPVPIDPYNDTKARAEAIILENNGKDGLLTCALRPSGIFGPGDRQNIPGFLKVYKSGKTKFTIGGGLNMFDWTYVGNVVYAHLLAFEKLDTSVPVSIFEDRLPPVKGSLPRRTIPTSLSAPLSKASSKEVSFTKEGSEIDPPLPATRNRFDQFFNVEDSEDGKVHVAGQAFYITNGEPVPFWSWARALWYEYAGHDKKMINLPTEVGLLYARVLSAACWLAGKESTLPVASVYYSTARRYYNIEKARRVLGYEPQTTLVDGMKEAVAWYKAHEAEIDAQNASAQKVKA